MPTTISRDNVAFLLSGAANSSPAASLGGVPSNVPLTDSENNLFQEITEDTNEGFEYRCIYFKNNSPDATLLDSSVYAIPLGGEAIIGVLSQNEVQQISLSGDVSGGSFAITYSREVDGDVIEQTTPTIEWTPFLDTMTESISDALNALAYLSEVIVTGERPSATQFIYRVTFAGVDGNRSHSTIAIANPVMYGVDVAFSVSKLVAGSPIMATADSVGFPNQPPFSVDFVETSETETIPVGDLGPGDYFSIWIRRSVSEGDTEGGLRLEVASTAFFVEY